MKTNNNSTRNNPNVDRVNNLILKSHETEEEYFEALNADYIYQPQISFITNKESTNPEAIEITDAAKQIKDGTYKVVIDKMRNEESYDKRKELKLSLPAFMFGGVFQDRSTNVQIPSRLICIDFDHVPDLSQLKLRLRFNSSVYMFFTSPSGKGLKVVFRTDVQNDEQYKITIHYLFEQFKGLSIFPDEVKQSINDLCFVSYDPDIYFNPTATIILPES